MQDYVETIKHVKMGTGRMQKNNPKIQHIYHNFATCVKLKIYVNVYFLNCVRPRVKRVLYVSLHPKTFKVNNP